MHDLKSHTDKVKCSFCQIEATVANKVVLSLETGKAICTSCLGVAEQAAELAPKGAVKCLSCKSYDGVSVEYDKATVRWVFSGLNKEDTVGYRVTAITGTWDLNSIPKKATCIRCFCLIPLANLKLSPYIRPARR
jgi:hypothetical protein